MVSRFLNKLSVFWAGKRLNHRGQLDDLDVFRAIVPIVAPADDDVAAVDGVAMLVEIFALKFKFDVHRCQRSGAICRLASQSGKPFRTSHGIRWSARASLSITYRLFIIHFFGKFGPFLTSRICWMCRSACVEISNIHCQQSIILSPSPKLWARKSSLVVLMYSIMVARSA